MKRSIRIAMTSALVATAGVTGGSWWMGGRLTAAAHAAVPHPPDFAVEDVWIPQAGSGGLAGWWAPAGRKAPAVLLLHPFRGNRGSMVERARLLRDRGFSVLLVDFQAHGESPGETITLGIRESENVRSALAWLRRRAPESRIGVVGVSLGGASVLLGPQPCGFDAVVLEEVYPDIRRAVVNRLRIRLGSLAPAVAPLLLMQLKPRLGVGPEDLRPIDGISRLGAPVLIVAGELDERTTPAESEELYRAADEPKSLWVVAGARHENCLSKDPAGYQEHVIGFLLRHLAGHD